MLKGGMQERAGGGRVESQHCRSTLIFLGSDNHFSFLQISKVFFSMTDNNSGDMMDANDDYRISRGTVPPDMEQLEEDFSEATTMFLSGLELCSEIDAWSDRRGSSQVHVDFRRVGWEQSEHLQINYEMECIVYFRDSPKEQCEDKGFDRLPRHVVWPLKDYRVAVALLVPPGECAH